MAASRAYAEEVYAACATIGFTGEPAVRLKAMLDRLAASGDVDEAALLAAAQEAQRAAATWAGRGA